MNTSEINTQLSLIESIDFWEIVNLTYPDTDLSMISIGGWPLSLLVTNIERIIDQFKSKMEQDDFEFLPNNFSNVEFDGSGYSTVTSRLNNIHLFLVNRNFQEVLLNVKWLASYQASYGFWNKSVEKIHDPKTIDLQKKANEIETLKSKIESKNKEIEEIKNNLQNSYNELNSFYKLKQEELQSLTNSKQNIQSIQNDASTLLVQINDYRSQAESALKEAITTRDSSKKNSDEGKVFLDNFINKAELLKVELEKHISAEEIRIKSIDEDYKHISSKRDYIDLKEEDIIKLAAQASDGSLGHTFDVRQKVLGKNAFGWMLATIGMSFILFAWIFIVFMCLSDTDYYPNWINPLVSTLKTIPAFVILVFFARQYTKERNLQEEYAFKSAIAMTLTAYADEIAREDDEDRRNIIKETIEKVYKSPKITSETVSFFNIREKHLENLAEKTADNIGKVIGKVAK